MAHFDYFGLEGKELLCILYGNCMHVCISEFHKFCCGFLCQWP